MDQNKMLTESAVHNSVGTTVANTVGSQCMSTWVKHNVGNGKQNAIGESMLTFTKID